MMSGPRRGTVSAHLARALPPLPPLAQLAIIYARNYEGYRDRQELGRQLLRSCFFRLAEWFTPTLLADRGGVRYLVSTSDHTIGQSVFATGSWDWLQMHTTLRVLAAVGAPGPEGRTFVDVGANIGCTALPAVLEHGFARAVAYEPEPRAFRLLRENILLNAAQDRVTALEAALSDARSPVALAVNNGKNAGDNRLVPVADAAAVSPVPPQDDLIVHVPSTTFDEEVERGRFDLAETGLVWMDVQGHEGRVLAGASRLLRSDVPVLIEYSPQLLREAGDGAMDQLAALVQDNYTHFVDVRAAAVTRRARLRPASSIREMGRRRHTTSTDLLLLKR